MSKEKTFDQAAEKRLLDAIEIKDSFELKKLHKEGYPLATATFTNSKSIALDLLLWEYYPSHDTIKFLVDIGSNLNALNAEGDKPIHTALRNKNIGMEVIKLLAESAPGTINYKAIEIIEKRTLHQDELFTAIGRTDLIHDKSITTSTSASDAAEAYFAREDVQKSTATKNKAEAYLTMEDKIKNSNKFQVDYSNRPVAEDGCCVIMNIDSSFDPKYTIMQTNAFNKLGSELLTASEDFTQSRGKLLALEAEINHAPQIDITGLGFAGQQLLRFEPTIQYFFKILGVDLPKINLSPEVRSALDFAFGLIKTAANPDLLGGQILESGSYYTSMKSYELLNANPSSEKPTDLLSIAKICAPELTHGLASGLAIASPISGLISGAAQCFNKHQLIKEETASQTETREFVDSAIATLALELLDLNPLAKAMAVMSYVNLADISSKLAFAGYELAFGGETSGLAE